MLYSIEIVISRIKNKHIKRSDPRPEGHGEGCLHSVRGKNNNTNNNNKRKTGGVLTTALPQQKWSTGVIHMWDFLKASFLALMK